MCHWSLLLGDFVLFPVNTHVLYSLSASALVPSPHCSLPQILQSLPSLTQNWNLPTPTKSLHDMGYVPPFIPPTSSPTHTFTHLLPCSHRTLFVSLWCSTFTPALGPLQLLFTQVECVSTDTNRAGFICSSWSLFKCRLTWDTLSDPSAWNSSYFPTPLPLAPWFLQDCHWDCVFFVLFMIPLPLYKTESSLRAGLVSGLSTALSSLVKTELEDNRCSGNICWKHEQRRCS